MPQYKSPVFYSCCGKYLYVTSLPSGVVSSNCSPSCKKTIRFSTNMIFVQDFSNMTSTKLSRFFSNYEKCLSPIVWIAQQVTLMKLNGLLIWHLTSGLRLLSKLTDIRVGNRNHLRFLKVFKSVQNLHFSCFKMEGWTNWKVSKSVFDPWMLPISGTGLMRQVLHTLAWVDCSLCPQF